MTAEGELLWSGSRDSQGRASEACLELVTGSGYNLEDVTGFLADVGPGSFTGVRVGVTLAKTLAWTNNVSCGGADSFDLINANGTVVFPSKKNEWFVREPGQEVRRQTQLPTGPFEGFGPGLESQKYPLAERFALILNQIEWMHPMKLLPVYLIEPSISIPKNPLQVLGKPQETTHK